MGKLSALLVKDKLTHPTSLVGDNETLVAPPLMAHWTNARMIMERQIDRWAGFEISNWMPLSGEQVGCKNLLSECTIHLSEIYKANATYVKIRNMQSSVGQVLQVFHLSDCHFNSSQMIGRVKFWTLMGLIILIIHLFAESQMMAKMTVNYIPCH